MALKLHTTYPGRFDSPSENYPQGKWRNRSNSTAHDGGYLEEKHMNDIYGFFGALLRNAEMSPNGEVDTAKKSQFYDALVTVAKKAVGEEGYRKLDDNVFNGLMTIKSDNDEQGVGILLQESDGTVRGQVVATDKGLQLTQYPKDGGLQTFTFPVQGDGGEIALTSYVDDKIKLNTLAKGANGWWKCGDTGLIIQWGYVSTQRSVTFPIVFPAACTAVVGSEGNVTNSAELIVFHAQSITNSGFTALIRNKNGTNIDATVAVRYIAIGY